MSKIQVAKTILDQLGGKRFIGMTGAKNFVSSEYSIRFRVMRNSKKVNMVTISLNPMDLYDIKFDGVRGLKVTARSEALGVSVEQLQAVFTEHTRLFVSLSLPEVKARRPGQYCHRGSVWTNA